MSLVFNGNSTIDNIVFNGNTVEHLIYNGVEVWSKSVDYYSIPLTMEFIEDGTLTSSVYNSQGWPTSYFGTSYYSINGGSEQEFITRRNSPTTITVHAGDKIVWNTLQLNASQNGTSYYGRFTSTAKFNVYGNLGLSADNSFYYVTQAFYNCNTVVNADNLIYPFTNNTASDRKMNNLFYNCTSLVSAPLIPYTSLGTNDYMSLYYGCTNLKKYGLLTTKAVSALPSAPSGIGTGGTFIKAQGVELAAAKYPSNWTIEERPYVKLIPNGTFTKAGTDTLTFTNPSNIATESDSTTYVSFNVAANKTYKYYIQLDKSNLSQIPSNEIIRIFSANLRYTISSNSTTISSLKFSLYSGSTQIGSGSIDKNGSYKYFGGYNLDKSLLNDIKICMEFTGASSGTAATVRIYGAELNLFYET